MAVHKKTKYVGLRTYSKNNSVNVRKYANSKSTIVAQPNRYVNNKVHSFGNLTGFYTVTNSGTWYQTTVGNKKGWVLSTQITTAKATSSSDLSAQKMLNELVKNDVLIRKSLTRSLALMGSLNKSKNLPKELASKYASLLIQVSKRENEIKSSKLLKAQTGISKSYNNFMQKWGLGFLKISGIGVVPIVAWIIGVVVVGGLGAAVTAYFLSYHGESKVDLNISADLEKALATLDPGTAKKIKEDLQGQIDNSFKKGYSTGKGSTFFGSLKIVGILVFGALAADKLIPKRK